MLADITILTKVQATLGCTKQYKIDRVYNHGWYEQNFNVV